MNRPKATRFLSSKWSATGKNKASYSGGDQGWQLPRPEELPDHTAPLSLAPDIRALLTARLDRLPLAVKAVVQTAAILGPEFPQPVLAAMLPEDKALADHITLAENAEVWHKIGAVTYRFHHGLLRDAAYAMQVRAQLQKLHALAAAAIRAHYPDLQPYYAALVHHYYHAADQAAERRYARLAGAFAAQQHLNHEAVRYFDRVLALTPPTALQEQYEIVVAREAAHRLLGRFDGTIPGYSAAGGPRPSGASTAVGRRSGAQQGQLCAPHGRL
jgi:hypothetical protein